MTHLKNLVLASAALLVSSGALAAQATGSADVPFAFRIPGRTLPAGKYLVSTHIGNHQTAMLRDLESRRPVFVLTPVTLSTSSASLKAENSRLVFTCEPGDCALQQIWLGGEGLTVPVPRHHAGKERFAMIRTLTR